MNLIENFDELAAMKWACKIWANLDSTIIFNSCMKTLIINNHISRTKNSHKAATFDPKQDDMIEFWKGSLPVQHYIQREKLQKPIDERKKYHSSGTKLLGSKKYSISPILLINLATRDTVKLLHVWGVSVTEPVEHVEGTQQTLIFWTVCFP